MDRDSKGYWVQEVGPNEESNGHPILSEYHSTVPSLGPGVVTSRDPSKCRTSLPVPSCTELPFSFSVTKV